MSNLVQEALDAALAGDFGPCDALLERLDATSSGACALRASADLAHGRDLGSVEFLARKVAAFEASPDAFAAATCAYQFLAAVLDFDVALCSRLRDAQHRLAHSPTTKLLARRADLWCDFFDGLDIADAAQRFGHDAAELRAPAERIEATALAALTAAAHGTPAEAVALARRATRMARAEGLVHHEYLANLVLARARRVSGRPHLAARIVGGLARVVPSAWRKWVDWESAMAGADGAMANAPCSVALALALDAAQRGDRVAVGEALDQLRHVAADAAPFANEMTHLTAALDPDAAPVDSPWARSEINDTWDVLCASDDGSPQAFVYVRPDLPARRLIAAGAGLVEAGTARIATTHRKDARVMRLVATLAASGPEGIDDGTLFHRVYGFPYETKHESTARVLVHRARSLLGEHADIARSEGLFIFRPAHALLIADPWCARSLEQRIMMLLGSRAGELKASEIAEALGVSTRQVQRALKSLNEAGACSSGQKRGYRLEDTTFSEPTRSRVMPG